MYILLLDSLPNGKIINYNNNLYYGASNTQLATNNQINNLQLQINNIRSKYPLIYATSFNSTIDDINIDLPNNINSYKILIICLNVGGMNNFLLSHSFTSLSSSYPGGVFLAEDNGYNVQQYICCVFVNINDTNWIVFSSSTRNVNYAIQLVSLNSDNNILNIHCNSAMFSPIALQCYGF